MAVDTDLFVATAEEEGVRIDKLLSERFEQKSRSYFQFLIDNGFVLVNGAKVKKRYFLKDGDEIEIFFQLTPEISLEPEDIPLNILYEDEHLLAINKPSGMVVHPGPGHFSGTFVNALLAHLHRKVQPDEGIRPGIVHRLDKDTSGILLAAKTPLCHQKLVEDFCMRRMEKHYFAICVGKVKNGLVDAPIGRNPKKRQEMAVMEEGGKDAATEFTLLAYHDGLSFALAKPITGRTHQIRVHLKHIHAPVLGDAIYGSKTNNPAHHAARQLLHAYRLKFTHPITGVPMEIVAPLPDDFKAALRQFNFLCDKTPLYGN